MLDLSCNVMMTFGAGDFFGHLQSSTTRKSDGPTHSEGLSRRQSLIWLFFVELLRRVWTASAAHPFRALTTTYCTIAIAIHALHRAGIRLYELFYRDCSIAIFINVLKTAHNTTTSHIEPKGLKFTERQLTVLVCIVFLKKLFSGGIQFGLGQLSVFIGIKAF